MSATSPAPAPVAHDTTAVADVLADFRVSVPRKTPYKLRADSPRIAVPAIGQYALVTRGSHDRLGPALFVINGDAVTALPLSAFAAAIAGGVITPEEIAAITGNAPAK